MHETSQEIEALQVLLDRSYESAGEHLLSIHNPKWRMSAREICSHLVKVCVLDLATVNASGNSRVAPVDGLFLGGRFWFGSSHKSQRFRHIRGNPNISAAYTKGEEVSILIHGIAHEIDTTRSCERGDATGSNAPLAAQLQPERGDTWTTTRRQYRRITT